MIATIPLSRRVLAGDLSVPFYLSVAKLVVHLAVNINGGYGLFRDELYYIACAGRLDTGYVDHPLLSIYLLKLNILLFGDSLFSIRLIPALCAAATVWVTGLITIRLGGGKLAQWVACLLTFSLGNLVMSSFYSMNSLEILSWTLAVFCAVLIIQTEQRKYWIILGVVLGLGLLNKIGVLFLGAGIFAGLIFTKERRWLLTPWPYVCGIIAGVLFLPYVIWNIQHDYAHLEFIRNASSQKYAGLSMISFLSGLLLINNPVAILFWLPGLVALGFSPLFSRYRFLVFLFLAPFLILLLNGTSKELYLLPAYSLLWAAGAVWYESLALQYRYIRISGLVVMGLWLITTVVLLPVVLPVLSVKDYIAYSAAIGMKPASSEGKELAELPQFYADMFGWEEKAASVATALNSLTEQEKRTALIFSNNYGRCASIEYYGDKYGLPAVIGNHNNYWIWGYPHPPDPLIILGGDAEDHERVYEDVTVVTVSECDYCMPYENHVPVYVCRGLKEELGDVWPRIKHYQ